MAQAKKAAAAGDAKANPFTLAAATSDPGAARKKFLGKTYSEADKAKMLEMYVEVPADLWPELAFNQHVRYVTKDGLFRPGGFVVKAKYEGKGPEAVTKSFMMLQNGPKAGPNVAKWPVAYEDIQFLYSKCTVNEIVLRRQLVNVVAGVNEQTKRIAAAIKSKQ